MRRCRKEIFVGIYCPPSAAGSTLEVRKGSAVFVLANLRLMIANWVNAAYLIALHTRMEYELEDSPPKLIEAPPCAFHRERIKLNLKSPT